MRVWMRRVGCLMMSRKLPPAAAALGFVRTICQRLCQENILSEQSTKDYRLFKSCVHENGILSKSDLLWLDRLSIHLAGLGKDLLGILHATPDWRRDSIGPTLCLPPFLGFNHLTLQPSSSSHSPSSSYFATIIIIIVIIIILLCNQPSRGLREPEEENRTHSHHGGDDLGGSKVVFWIGGQCERKNCFRF